MVVGVGPSEERLAIGRIFLQYRVAVLDHLLPLLQLHVADGAVDVQRGLQRLDLILLLRRQIEELVAVRQCSFLFMRLHPYAHVMLDRHHVVLVLE